MNDESQAIHTMSSLIYKQSRLIEMRRRLAICELEAPHQVEGVKNTIRQINLKLDEFVQFRLKNMP